VLVLHFHVKLRWVRILRGSPIMLNPTQRFSQSVSSNWGCICKSY